MDSIGKSNMLSVLVTIGLVVLSEAGVIHQHHGGYGLSNHLLKSYPARSTSLGRLYNYPLGSRLALQYAPSLASNSVILKHASGPVTVTRIPAPQIHSIGNPAKTYAKVSLPSSIRHTPLTFPSANNLLPPVVLNSAPLNFAPVDHSSTNLLLSPGIFNSASVISSPPLQTLTSSHVVNPSIHNTYTTVDIPDKSVSYSISQKDFEYLKHHKVEGQDSPYKPVGISTIQEPKTHHNPNSHHEKDSTPVNVLADADNQLKKSTAAKRGLLSTDIIQSSLESNLIQETNYISFPQESLINSDNELNHVNIPEQVVSKHIYFHVPPPDFEEPPRAPHANIAVSVPKKTYNIVFIKAPSQEPKNKVYLQQSQVQDKTLIYVLTKKQDPQDFILPAQEPSNPKASRPEVYFIKYRTKLGDIADISNEHIEEALVETDSPVLERKRRLGDSISDSTPEKPTS